MSPTGKEVCLAHSGICSDIGNIKQSLEHVNTVEIPDIKESITQLRIFIAKVTGGSMVVGFLLQKFFL